MTLWKVSKIVASWMCQKKRVQNWHPKKIDSAKINVKVRSARSLHAEVQVVTCKLETQDLMQRFSLKMDVSK